MSRQARFTLCFCVAVILLGPFGLIVGPLLSRYLNKRVQRLHPGAAMAAEARSGGHYNFGQLVAITACLVWAIIAAVAIVPTVVLLVAMLFA